MVNEHPDVVESAVVGIRADLGDFLLCALPAGGVNLCHA